MRAAIRSSERWGWCPRWPRRRRCPTAGAPLPRPRPGRPPGGPRRGSSPWRRRCVFPDRGWMYRSRGTPRAVAEAAQELGAMRPRNTSTRKGPASPKPAPARLGPSRYIAVAAGVLERPQDGERFHEAGRRRSKSGCGRATPATSRRARRGSREPPRLRRPAASPRRRSPGVGLDVADRGALVEGCRDDEACQRVSSAATGSGEGRLGHGVGGRGRSRRRGGSFRAGGADAALASRTRPPARSARAEGARRGRPWRRGVLLSVAARSGALHRGRETARGAKGRDAQTWAASRAWLGSGHASSDAASTFGRGRRAATSGRHPAPRAQHGSRWPSLTPSCTSFGSAAPARPPDPQRASLRSRGLPRKHLACLPPGSGGGGRASKLSDRSRSIPDPPRRLRTAALCSSSHALRTQEPFPVPGTLSIPCRSASAASAARKTARTWPPRPCGRSRRRDAGCLLLLEEDVGAVGSCAAQVHVEERLSDLEEPCGHGLHHGGKPRLLGCSCGTGLRG